MTGQDPVEPDDLDDDALMVALGRALGPNPPAPPGVIADAVAAYTWRTIDAELAELAYDSASAVSGTRGPAGSAREVTFRSGDVEIEVLVAGGADAHLEGQLIPPVADTIELAGLHGAETAAVDEFGRFRFGEVPTGPVCLGLRRPDGWVRTTWMVLRAA